MRRLRYSCSGGVVCALEPVQLLCFVSCRGFSRVSLSGWNKEILFVCRGFVGVVGLETGWNPTLFKVGKCNSGWHWVLLPAAWVPGPGLA